MKRPTDGSSLYLDLERSLADDLFFSGSVLLLRVRLEDDDELELDDRELPLELDPLLPLPELLLPDDDPLLLPDELKKKKDNLFNAPGLAMLTHQRHYISDLRNYLRNE